MKRSPYRFASRVSKMSSSIIREILKVSSRPNVISFAGGLPAPSAFPLKQFERAVRDTFRIDGTRALQYMVTEGHRGLKFQLLKYLKTQGIHGKADHMLFTNGSQQALELLGKILLNKGDKILMEDPTYLGAIQCFNGHEITYVTVPLDNEGPDPAELKRQLSHHKVKFIYTVPTFQNPAGFTMSLGRRRILLAEAKRHNIPIIEDDPYGVLRFRGKPVPSLYALSKGKGVIYLSTFSKLLSPGIRLGFVLAEPSVIHPLLLAKQATDLQTNSLIQYAVYHYCRRGNLARHIPKIIKDYKHRAGVMMEAIRHHFPPEVECREPEGGMFVWCQLPQGIRASEVFQKAIRRRVAFVDGSVFFANGGGENTMRLNFTSSTDEQIRTGIATLGRVLKSFL